MVVDRVLLEAQAGELGEEPWARPVSTRNQRPADGSSTTMSLSSSRRMRSGATISRRGEGRHRGDQLGLGARPYPLRKRAARSMRRVVGEGDLGRQRRAQPAVHEEVDHAVRRVDELEAPGNDRAMALTVKSPPREVGLDGVGGELDLGLAESGR